MVVVIIKTAESSSSSLTPVSPPFRDFTRSGRPRVDRTDSSDRLSWSLYWTEMSEPVQDPKIPMAMLPKPAQNDLSRSTVTDPQSVDDKVRVIAALKQRYKLKHVARSFLQQPAASLHSTVALTEAGQPLKRFSKESRIKDQESRIKM